MSSDERPARLAVPTLAGIAIMQLIYLLGSFQVLAEDEPLKFSTLPSTLLLWAYLLLNPAPSAHDQLAPLFGLPAN